MALNTRALTVHLQRAVIGDGPPTLYEVAVNPLSTPSSPSANATLVARDSQDVLVGNDVVNVVFNLVPTDDPGLTERVTYRIAWREKYMGRMFTQDFVMPDFDVDFDDLEDLGNIIGGTTYLQWTDRSSPGGVAGLNNQGEVIDADGNVVSGASEATTVQGNLDAEAVARQTADSGLRTFVQQYVGDQITQVYSSAAANLNAAIVQLENADTTEKGQRQVAVSTLNATIANIQTSTNASLAALDQTLDDFAESLTAKADLVGGKIPSAQLPSIALGQAVPVADQAHMLALTTAQVQPGDFAVRPDGIFFLNSVDPSVLSNWVQFQVAATVLSVNGHTGAVVLAAADVGARPAGVNIAMSEITGLSSALSLKTDSTVTNAINVRLQTVENDATIVRTVSGLIAKALMPADTAFINTSNLVTKKDGTVLDLGSGGTLDISDVTGLQAALDAKLATTDASVTNARTPTAHAASHATAGSDPVSPASIGAATATHTHAQTDITGLVAILSENGFTTSSNVGARVGSLETRVEDLETEGGGGGGGAGASGKTVWFSDVAPINPLDTSTDSIEVRSPFGFDGTNYFYDPAGVDPTEAVWPYLTPNGHLKFIKRDETAATDDVLATEAALTSLGTVVATKANQADLDTANAAINTKATLSALSTLQAEVDTKATETDVNTINDTLAIKANQSAVDALSTTVAGKANEDDVSGLVDLVGTKADASAVTALTTRVSTVETGKADLVSGTVPLAEIPSLDATKVPGLTTKADLVSGTVPLAQLPSFPTSKTTGLDAALAAKADLVGGMVATSQLPALSLTTAVSVASRAAMLALNTTQVQPGDIAVITTTADQGSYILTATDPTQFANWVKLVAPADAVSSVNGQTGTVVLTAANVGARDSSVAIAQTDVSGLVTALASKADSATMTTALAGKTAPADVVTLVDSGFGIKQAVDYVATVNVASTSGSQSIDGVLVGPGARVLLTAQSASINNGIYTVANTAWTRVADMAAGTTIYKGTLVFVKSGTAFANTVWQMNGITGVVATNNNSWGTTPIMFAGAAPAYTATNGVQKTGTVFQAQVVANGGVLAVAGGLQLDPNVSARKFSATAGSTGFPSGSTVVTITHNLGTTDVIATFRDAVSGDTATLGWKPTGINTISAEFGTTVASGQWRVTVIG